MAQKFSHQPIFFFFSFALICFLQHSCRIYPPVYRSITVLWRMCVRCVYTLVQSQRCVWNSEIKCHSRLPMNRLNAMVSTHIIYTVYYHLKASMNGNQWKRKKNLKCKSLLHHAGLRFVFSSFCLFHTVQFDLQLVVSF